MIGYYITLNEELSSIINQGILPKWQQEPFPLSPMSDQPLIHLFSSKEYCKDAMCYQFEGLFDPDDQFVVIECDVEGLDAFFETPPMENMPYTAEVLKKIEVERILNIWDIDNEQNWILNTEFQVQKLNEKVDMEFNL